MDGCLGVDVGSVTARCAIITEGGELIADNYLCTQGKPVPAGRQGLKEVQGQLPLRSEPAVHAPQAAPAKASGRYCGWSGVEDLLSLRLPFIMSRTYVPISCSAVRIQKPVSIRDGTFVDYVVNGSLCYRHRQLSTRIEDFG